MMYCQAITPDGRRLTFDDVLSPGQVVHDERHRYYVVGPDLGDEDPRLMPMDRDHYMLYWRAINTRASWHGFPVVEASDMPPGGFAVVAQLSRIQSPEGENR